MHRHAVRIRALRADDGMLALTAMLHRAYAPLLARGWNYTACDQSEEVTRERCAAGVTLLAECDGAVVGTITRTGSWPDSASAWYRRTDVQSFHQFAVEPALQGRGIGRLLLNAVEDAARREGARELACDTAAPAVHLVEWYERLGWRTVERVRWAGKRYDSVILSKALRS
jgi:GNAT superfamily N-acetyltransferase